MKQNDVGINIQPPEQAVGSLRDDLKRWLTVKANLSDMRKEVERLEEIEEGIRRALAPEIMTFPNQQVAVGDSTIVASIAHRDSPKYKDAFELALTKVNEATQAIIADALASTMGHSEWPELKVKAGKKLKVKAIVGTVQVA
jgi:asparagine synthetase B (glutamine-hydrolysing)